MYNLYAYDKAMERIGVVEGIASLQWLAMYQDAGEIKIVTSATPKNLSLLQLGYRLYNTEQESSAIICEADIEDDGKTATITVRALLSASRWAERVIMATEQIKNVEAGMLMLTAKHRRGLLGTTAVAKGLPHTTDTQITWGSVLDAEIQLATASALGFREIFNPTSCEELFEVYAGTDRTQGEAYNGYFGDDIGNLSDIKITSGTADFKNVAIVGGMGEGAQRKIVIVGIGIGDARHELWVDAKDISQTYQIATPNGIDEDGNPKYTYTEAAHSEAQYTALLEARGLEKLAENLKTMEVSATLGQGSMVYGKDYFLGDIVPLKITQYGLRVSARISAVKTIYESTGKVITAILSDFKTEALK